MTKLASHSRGGSKPGERRGGRQRGTPNKSSIRTWERVEREGDPIAFLCRVLCGDAIQASPLKQGENATEIIPTLDQRLTAASQLTRWMPPPPRVRPLALDIPKMEKPHGMVAVMAAVTEAMTAGEITPDEAKAVAEVVELQRRSIETQDLEQRIAALERSKA